MCEAVGVETNFRNNAYRPDFELGSLWKDVCSLAESGRTTTWAATFSEQSEVADTSKVNNIRGC